MPPLPRSARKKARPRTLMCPVLGCYATFKNHTGLGNHLHTYDYLNYSNTSNSDSDIAVSDDDDIGHTFDNDLDDPVFPLTPPPEPNPTDTRNEANRSKVERKFHAKLN
ncbi:hypothetical protein V5O48_015853, partial [Marasmius crinis-equi]